MQSRRLSPGRSLLLILVLGTAALIATVALLEGQGSGAVRTSLAVAEALSADTSGFARAVEARALEFPDDHGPHPDYRTEWWYWTGNVEASDGRHFGYQVTIFRTALRPAADSVDREGPGNSVEVGRGASASNSDDSLWSTRQLYMAHFSLSDAASEAFYSFERFSRGAAGLAGAQSAPFRVWLEDWSIRGATADSVRIVAAADEISIDLSLKRSKPIVLQGEEGLDAKGPQPGNASYYYSMTRMQTAGRLAIDARVYTVEGLSWMDHEWSTSALGADLVGWDWFALQLEDGRELMYYRLRKTEGGSSPYSGGVIVDRRGGTERLGAEDVRLQPTDYWESAVTGHRYPVEWSLRIPSHDLVLRVEPFLREQELAQSVAYWEGAVRVEGSHDGAGFVELTGYGDSDRIFATR